MDIVDRQKNGQSAEEMFLEQEAANDVWKHVMALATKFREVIVLQAKYQLSVSEIADILRISEGTVKSRLFRARKKMAILLTKEVVFDEIN